MTLRELAEITISARRSARHFSGLVSLSMRKLAPLGFTATEVDLVEKAVEEIEAFERHKLATLDAIHRS